MNEVCWTLACLSLSLLLNALVRKLVSLLRRIRAIVLIDVDTLFICCVSTLSSCSCSTINSGVVVTCRRDALVIKDNCSQVNKNAYAHKNKQKMMTGGTGDLVCVITRAC